jgi:hypothetical protein
MPSARNVKRSSAESTKKRKTGPYVPSAQHQPAQAGLNFPTGIRRGSKRSANKSGSIETSGEVFSDGSSIALLRESESDGLTLLLTEGEKHRIASQVETGGRAFVPPQLSPSMLRALTLPTNCVPYGSTSELFTSVRQAFADHGFPEAVAVPASFFVLASWFAEILPAAPCLSITGSRPESILLLQLLACLVRHPLTLGEIGRSALCSLPLNLQLTLFSESVLRLLSVSNRRDANILWKGELRNIFAAKALYQGEIPNAGLSGDDVLQVNVAPSMGRFPFLDPETQREIASKFQGRLLSYRLRNFQNVGKSEFDLPGFASGIRVLSRVLGAPIVGAPEIQADVASLLQNRQDEATAGCWVDLRCVAIEGALHHCHQGTEDRLYVGELTRTMGVILQGRGENKEVEPREIGGILRSLGLTLKRDSRGFAIGLSDTTRRRIHELAREYQVAAVRDGLSVCAHCTAVFAADGAANDPG